MDKDPSPILVVFLDAVVLAFIILFQRAQNKFLQLAAAFAGYDLNALGLLGYRLFHNFFNRLIKLVALGINIMKI